MLRSPDNVPVAIRGPLAAVSRPWQVAPPKDALCVIVKSTWSIKLDGVLSPLADQPPPRGDILHDDDPTATPRHASELAPFKPRADVLLVGHAYPGSGDARNVAHVSLGLGSMRRTLAAIGARRWQGGVPSVPERFHKLPLRWEAAFGGSGVDLNPAGVGADGATLPSLEQPDALLRAPSDRPAPACFAPIAATWRARRDMLGSYDAKWLAERWPYFPRDFDWGYFNVAPPAQQLPYLRGDERFDLAGVHPSQAVLSGKLPSLLPRAFALIDGERFVEIKLALDTVDFDADALTVALSWRGALEVSAEHAPEVAQLYVAADRLDAPRPIEEHRAESAAPHAEVAPDHAAPDQAAPDQAAPDQAAPDQAVERAASARPPRAPTLSRELALGLLGEPGSPAFASSLAGVTLAGCDLRDVDLRRRDLAAVDLSDARLDRARLDGANLRGALLVGAHAERCCFDGACLDDANLSEARLTDATFRGATLRAASLGDASAPGACFDDAQLIAAKLTDAQLDGCRFERANASDADFSGATLAGAHFRDATLSDARLYGARARDACFDGATITGMRADDAVMTRSSFIGVKADGVVMQATDLRSTRWLEADVQRGLFSHARLDGAILNRALARGARFRRASLAGASALKADLMEANFEGADLSSCDLRGASLYAAELWKATLDGARLDLATTAGTKLAR